MRRRPLSLLEVMIAIFIAGILFAVLFRSQMDTATSARTVEQVKQAVYQREKFYLRLLPLFSHLEKCALDEKRLVLTYDNGADPDPAFCGRVHSLLYMDKNCLLLATWGKEDKLRTEVLWEGAKGLSFDFFVKDCFIKEPAQTLPPKIKVSVKDSEGTDHLFPYWTGS